jgi:hypothetical protein
MLQGCQNISSVTTGFSANRQVLIVAGVKACLVN